MLFLAWKTEMELAYSKYLNWPTNQECKPIENIAFDLSHDSVAGSQSFSFKLSRIFFNDLNITFNEIWSQK